ncbi:hypothetical protein SISSUDRAFT_961284, partial [Sistotremastrum suecicum HHB10207 ss-3]
PPLRWVLLEGGAPIPSDALQTGTEVDNEELYSVRAWYKGGVHPGKAGEHLQDGRASISYGGLEHPVSTFEILIGDSSYARWIDVTSTVSESLSQNRRPIYPIEAGREATGEPLFVAQAQYDMGWHPGKAALHDDHCCVGYGGGEVWIRSFRIL